MNSARRGKHMKNNVRATNIKGKHFEQKKHSLISKKMLIQITTLLGICVVSSTSAYFMMQNSISNEFIVGTVKIEVIEKFDKKNKTKEEVCIKNIGNVPAYVRAAIIITWQDTEGRILETKPEENVDYSIEFSTSENWILGTDGYYYYKEHIDENKSTDILIEECTQTKQYEDRILVVSIAAQAIQAQPNKAVSEAWDIKVVNDKISLEE